MLVRQPLFPVFEDSRSRALLRQLDRIAPSDITVLVTGETGTGKEMVARYLHEASERGGGPFAAVNCGALSPTLMESELFGYEKGAFTGASHSRPGWFEAADGGTLFLDEVGDLPLAAQVKLLRVLQEREVVRIGARRPLPIDVRVVAATNTDLETAVAEGRFREDLYYRLNVAHLFIAPLRERPGDVLSLARHFLAQHANRLGMPRPELTPEAAQVLTSHRWPGNIRELENAILRALVASRDARITADDLHLSRSQVRPLREPPPPPVSSARGPQDLEEALEAALLALFERGDPELYRAIEDIIFRTAYAASKRNQLAAARLLGVSRNVIRARLMQQGLLPSPVTPPLRDSA